MSVNRPSDSSHHQINKVGAFSTHLYLFCISTVAAILALSGCAKTDPKHSSFNAEEKNARPVAFSDITVQAGLGGFKHENGAFGAKWFPEPMGSGGGFIDYDGDGWQDILLVAGGTWPGHSDKRVPALYLYRNNGDGTFSQTTDEAGLSEVSTYGFGITVADYDNDGDQDFFLTTLYENMLFRNDNNIFSEVGKETGVANESTLSTSALFFDADRDGWLDLYVGNYTDWSPETDVWCSFEGEKGYCTPELYDGVPSRFYRNNGDGTFTDMTEKAGFLPAPGKTLGIAEHDFNKDGWPDLAVANDLVRNLLYENNRDGTFSEKGMASGMAFDETGKARAGMGIDAGIVDGSGEVSIFIGNFQNEMIGVYRYMGNGFFMDRAALSKIGRVSLQFLTFGLFLFDVDLEGDLDLLTVNGHIQIEIESNEHEFEFRQLPQIYLNRGNGIFDLVTPKEGSVLATPIVGRGAAYADYDRDGDLDILITENAGPAHLWRNELSVGSFRENQNFLRVGLKGQESNRDGIGSIITIVMGGRKMSQRVRTGSSYLSQSEKIATFGLGDVTTVDSLRIEWPSGRIDHFEKLNSNQEISITEGSGRLVRKTSL